MSERADRKRCASPGCVRQVPVHLLACGPHWYGLPADLRDEIWAAYSAGDTIGHRTAVVKAIHVWTEQRDAAAR